MKFETILNNQVDMCKVNLDSIKPWISSRLTDILNHEDEVVIGYVYNQLEPQYPDPKEIQANLSGFLSMKNARIFVADLWQQLIDSMQSAGDRKDSKITKHTLEKVNTVVVLSSPENDKIVIRHNSSESKRLKQREEHRHYKHYSYSKSRSRSRSYSYHYKYRDRDRRRRPSSHSRYRRRPSSNYRRSRSRSSTGHTPYTRYSDYTDDVPCFHTVSSSAASSEDSSSSSSGSTSSSSSSSEIKTFSTGQRETDKSDTIEGKSTPSECADDSKFSEELCVTCSVKSNEFELELEQQHVTSANEVHVSYCCCLCKLVK